MINGESKKDFDLQERLIDFAVRIIGIVEALPTNRVGNHFASQLARSGTSPAPNYGEAQSAESRKDFIHKMKVALKKLRETHVWLLMIQRKPLIEPAEKFTPILAECDELIAIFVSSIKTAEKNNGSYTDHYHQRQLHFNTGYSLLDIRYSFFSG